MAADRYTRLLGLPAEPRPVDHYALLGLPGLAGDIETIRRQARDVLNRLAAHVGGPDNDEAVALVAEIGQAIRVLTDPEQREQYNQPLYDRKWPEFVALAERFVDPSRGLSSAARVCWAEAGLAMGLPWRRIREHIDAAAACGDASTTVPSGLTSPDRSLEQGDAELRCLALGAAIAGVTPDTRAWLLGEGASLGLPQDVSAVIIRDATVAAADDCCLPVGDSAACEQRREAFERVVHGAMLDGVLRQQTESRLVALAERGGLSHDDITRAIENQLQRNHAVRRRTDLRSARPLTPFPSDRFPGTPAFEAQTAVQPTPDRQAGLRRVVVVTLIGVIVVGLAAVILYVLKPDLFGRHDARTPPSASASAQDDLLAARRQAVLASISDVNELARARTALSGSASATQRLQAVKALDPEGSEPWLVELLGLVMLGDKQVDVRLAAVERLNGLDSPASRAVMAGAIEPGQPVEVVARVATLLARRRDAEVARRLLGPLTSADNATSRAAARCLADMTGLELATGMPKTSEDRDRYGALVARWVAAGGPQPGTLWDELPSSADILAMQGDAAGSPRGEMLLRLVRQGERGNRQAWDRLVEIVPREPSAMIRNALAAELGDADADEAALLDVLLLADVDDRQADTLLASLVSRAEAASKAAPPDLSGQGRLGRLFRANELRQWYKNQWPETAARYADAMQPLSSEAIFEAAVARMNAAASPVQPDEVTQLVRATGSGDFVAASLLMVLLRRDAAGQACPHRDNVLTVLAAVPTRQAWFFLVNELPRAEALPFDVEEALLNGALKDAIIRQPLYDRSSFGRYLAWHYAMRLGIAHADRLQNTPFLRSRIMSEAMLPVLVPDRPPIDMAEMVTEAVRLYALLDDGAKVAAIETLRERAAAGDEIAAAVTRQLTQP
ncbi:MAG: hypothetical protein JXL80_09735 [Planctomycetes bacterium]|nr:hypothetical protein [Planctomycetota bacterium]